MRRRELLAGAAAALWAGCGYSLQGRGITTDPSVRTIGVPLFKDKTGKPSLDQRVTGAVIAELQKRGRFKVVKETTGVDAVVEGEIMAYTVAPIAYGPNVDRAAGDLGLEQATRYSITLTAKVVYRKIGQKEPLWVNEAFSHRDDFDVGDTAQAYFDREDQAIARVADEFARSVVAAMLEAF